MVSSIAPMFLGWLFLNLCSDEIWFSVWIMEQVNIDELPEQGRFVSIIGAIFLFAEIRGVYNRYVLFV